MTDVAEEEEIGVARINPAEGHADAKIDREDQRGDVQPDQRAHRVPEHPLKLPEAVVRGQGLVDEPKAAHSAPVQPPFGRLQLVGQAVEQLDDDQLLDANDQSRVGFDRERGQEREDAADGEGVHGDVLHHGDLRVHGLDHAQRGHEEVVRQDVSAEMCLTPSFTMFTMVRGSFFPFCEILLFLFWKFSWRYRVTRPRYNESL